MPTYVVVAPQRVLAGELTQVAPRRTLPDWYLGDERHRAGTSDHNLDDTPGWSTEQTDADSIPEVRGGDYRLPFNAPFTPEQFVQWLVRRARDGKLPWLRYVIYNRRIWTRSNGWVTQRYNGSNPHDKHVHVSSLASRDTDRTSPALAELVRSVRPAPTPTEDDGMAGMTPADVRRQAALGVHDGLYTAFSGKDFNGLPYGSPGSVGRTIRLSLTGLIVTPLIEAIKADDNLDEHAVAALLAPMVIEGVVAKLPTDLDDVTVDELREVFRLAFLADGVEVDDEPQVEQPAQ
jgi:hypothetical protein